MTLLTYLKLSRRLTALRPGYKIEGRKRKKKI